MLGQQQGSSVVRIALHPMTSWARPNSQSLTQHLQTTQNGC